MDKSKNANDLTSFGIAHAGPAYTTGVMNSRPVARFNNNSLAKFFPAMGNSTDNFTVIGVLKVASNSGWDNWVDWGNGNSGGGDLDVFVPVALVPEGRLTPWSLAITAAKAKIPTSRWWDNPHLCSSAG